jgi:hypothetical protein
MTVFHTTATATWTGGADADLNDAAYAISLSGTAFVLLSASVLNDGGSSASISSTVFVR